MMNWNYSDAVNFAIAEHYERVNDTVDKLTELVQLGYDIDKSTVATIGRQYGLYEDGFDIDEIEILKQVQRRVR